MVTLVLMFMYLSGLIDFALLPFRLFLRIGGGGIFLLSGFVLFFWSHHHLGKNWSPIIEKRFSLSRFLVKTGPYAYIRHPIYTASFITLVGFFFLSANWILGGAPLLILGAFYVYKIPLEEKELLRNFGEEYSKYMKKTGGLLPKL